MKEQSKTVAIHRSDSSHWYYPDGRPCYSLPKKSGDGTKRPTLADARELKLLPGVTTVLKVIHKPALQDWLIMQAVLAAMTTPRKDGEELDAFLDRVLVQERVQDQESKAAADKGTQIHDAIDKALTGQDFDEKFKPFVIPVFAALETIYGKIVWTEKHLVGDGYAGRADVLLEGNNYYLFDFKTTSKLPTKDSWDEHKLQTAAYAAAIGNTGDKRIVTGNIYISTWEPGKLATFTQDDWQETYTEGFLNALRLWQHLNKYKP